MHEAQLAMAQGVFEEQERIIREQEASAAAREAIQRANALERANAAMRRVYSAGAPAADRTGHAGGYSWLAHPQPYP